MLKRHTFDKWLTLSALLFLSMGCVALPVAPGSTTAAVSTTDTLVVERIAPLSPGQCRLKVSLNQPPTGIDAHVFLTAEPGILFKNTSTQQSEQITMTLKAGETREHEFECQIDTPNIHLPGEYIVRAFVRDRVGQNVLYTAHTKVPIVFEEGGLPRFLPSQAIFDSQFNDGFIPGGGNVHYRLDVAPGVYATGGMLLLKVVSQQDSGDITLQASVLGGILFSDPSAETMTIALMDDKQHMIQVNFGLIAPYGSRIAGIPFRIAPNSMTGTYLLSVVEDNNMAPWMETAPILFNVESDSTLLAEQWLTGEQMAQAGPTVPAVSLATNVAVIQPTVPATATPVTAAPATPTPAPSQPTPEVLPTTMPTTAPTPTGGADVIQAMNFAWEQRLTNYYGSCRDIYQQRIEGKLAMSWETFRAAVIYYNPDLVNTECMFDPFREYWLPTAATAGEVQ